METLPYSFGIFTLCGVWRPISWSSGLKRVVYDFYTLSVMALVSSFAFMEFIETLLSFGRIQALVSASFMLFTVVNTCCKAVNIISKRDEIMSILGMLNDSTCLVRCEGEEKILDELQIRIRNNVAFFFCMVESAVFTITLSSVRQNIPNHSLPFEVWIPFNYTPNRIYWCLYYHQVLAHAVQGTISVAYDTMIPGVMLLTCGQLKLLKFRLENMMQHIECDQTKQPTINVERKFLRDMIYHHGITVKFARSTNNVFSSVIFIQYSVSCFVIGLSIYRLADIEVSNPEYPFAVFYFICITSQMFYFCWYGNEVIVESWGVTEAIYKMDWSSLNLDTQKDLLIVMQGTMKPIIFTSGKIFILSVESFLGIMKLSYTAFNVLHQR